MAHWTQTEAGKRKMSQVQKARWDELKARKAPWPPMPDKPKAVTVTANGWTVTLGETVQIFRTDPK